MTDREKVIGLLQEMAEYFRECRNNASFASKAENHFWELQNAATEAVDLLKELPEIVRCKDCKHYDSNTQSCNNGLDDIFLPDWFCADGERR